MDLNDMQVWQYFAIAGGGVLLLGLIVYFLPVGKVKVPAVVTTAFGGIVAGLALGVLLMAGFGYKPREEDLPPGTSGPPGKENEKALAKGKGNAPKGKGNFGGGGPPSPRAQLISLITALDAVADRPLVITLTPEERAMIAEQLKGLDSADEVKDEDAKKRLDAIAKIVEKNQKSLEAVGYRTTPAPKGSGLSKDNPNPFKEGATAQRLKSLLERLTKKG
jgi:hypothetical protein